jgi:hypothetical protein
MGLYFAKLVAKGFIMHKFAGVGLIILNFLPN